MPIEIIEEDDEDLRATGKTDEKKKPDLLVIDLDI